MRNPLRSILIASLPGTTVSPVLADTLKPVATQIADNAYAQRDDRDGRRGWRHRDEGGGEERVIPLDVVINGLMSQYPGKPLDARGPMQRGNQLIYEIVWLTQNGRQIVVIVDARSGQVLRVRGLG